MRMWKCGSKEKNDMAELAIENQSLRADVAVERELVNRREIRIAQLEEALKVEMAFGRKIQERGWAPEIVALLDVIEDLRVQNRELHDRLLAVLQPVALEQLSATRLAEINAQRMPVSEIGNLRSHKPEPVEVVGSQVGQNPEPMIDRDAD